MVGCAWVVLLVVVKHNTPSESVPRRGFSQSSQLRGEHYSIRHAAAAGCGFLQFLPFRAVHAQAYLPHCQAPPWCGRMCAHASLAAVPATSGGQAQPVGPLWATLHLCIQPSNLLAGSCGSWGSALGLWWAWGSSMLQCMCGSTSHSHQQRRMEQHQQQHQQLHQQCQQ